MITKEQLAEMIDHTNLHIDATEQDIEKLCHEAMEYNFGAVCIRYDRVQEAASHLKGSNVHIASVIGFPTRKYSTFEEMIKEQSQNLIGNRLMELDIAYSDGATDIDMVIDIESLKSMEYAQVKNDIEVIVYETENMPVKVIIEACFLTDEEKELACKIAEEAGAAYVKTSTGYGISGATLFDVELMSRVVSENIGIKPAGGISTVAEALRFYEASQKFKQHKFRVGASKLVNEYRK